MEDNHKPSDNHQSDPRQSIPDTQHRGNEPANSNTRDPQRASAREKKHPLEWLIFFFVVLTFAATATAAYYTRRQWLTADDQERRSLRAYVLVNTSSITIDSSNNIHASVQFKNGGLTPAYQMAGWGCLVVGRYEFNGSTINVELDFPSSPFDRSTAAKSIIGPGDTKLKSGFSFCDVNPPIIRSLTSDERNRLRNETAAIYIYGEETYVDAFGANRFVRYRFFSNDKIGGVSGATIDDLRGNDAN